MPLLLAVSRDLEETEAGEHVCTHEKHGHGSSWDGDARWSGEEQELGEGLATKVRTSDTLKGDVGRGGV